jgi:hypothetical protein
MQKLKTSVSLAVIAVCAAYLGWRYFGPLPKAHAPPHIGIGQALAEQAARLAAGGGRVVLITPDITQFRFPGAEIQLKAFYSALRKAGVAVAVTNRVKIDPNRLPRVPALDFDAMLRKYGENDVVVSLLGPPLLTPDQKAKLPAKHPRVVAVCSGDMPRQISIVPLFTENLLHAAIISRSNLPVTPPKGNDPREWFEYLYQIATAQNAADVVPSPRASL